MGDPISRKKVEGFAPDGRVSGEMKRSPYFLNRLRLGALAVVCIALGSNAAHAQNQPRVPLAPAPGFVAPVFAPPGQPTETPNALRFDFEFPGGSPAEFAKALSNAAGERVNLLIPDGVEDLRISKLNLSHVTVQDVLNGLSAIGSAFRGTSGAEWMYQFHQINGAVGPNGPRSVQPVWVLSAVRNQTTTKPNSILKVFSLSRYLGKPEQGLHSVEDIITAVQTGWKMQKISPLPELTYHPETKLLMAYGQDAHLTLITDVLKQLEPPVPAPVYKEKVNPEVMKTLEKGGLVMPQEPAKSK